MRLEGGGRGQVGDASAIPVGDDPAHGESAGLAVAEEELAPRVTLDFRRFYVLPSGSYGLSSRGR
jgi:hypothetical protein